MINHLGSYATQLLLHLFNQSLATGRLPKFWKEAIIQSIPKPGSDTYIVLYPSFLASAKPWKKLS